MDSVWLVFAQLWQVTSLIVLCLVMTRLIARDRPHLAYVLWLVVLVKCVTPPLLSSPSSAFSWVQTALLSESAGGVTATAFVTDSPRAINSGETLSATPLPGEVVVHVTPREIKGAIANSVTSGIDRRPARKVWLLGLLVVWVAGMFAALLVTGYRWLTCIGKLRRAPAIEAPELQVLTTNLSRRLRVRRKVGLLVTSSRVGPAVIGLLRPMIVLPEAVVRDKRPEDLKAIIAHELIHVRRGDLWLGLLQVLAKAVWWFYPLVWWVSRLTTREAERCCDEEVVGELGCDPRHYAKSLLDVLELKRTLQPVPAFPGMKPVEVTSQRLERIMKLGHGCHKRTPRWCWALMFFLAVAVLPGAAFIAADEPADYTSSTNGLHWSAIAESQSAPREAPRTTTEQDTQAAAKRMAKYGPEQMMVDIRFVSVPERLAKGQITDWELTPLDLGSEAVDGPRRRALDPIDRPLPTENAEPSAKSGITTATNLPALYKIVDSREAARLLAKLQRDTRTKILSAPKVTLFNGQSASIGDSVQRPFVVGVKMIGAEKRAAQPQIRIVETGNLVRIRPVLRDTNNLWLDFDIKVTRIEQVRNRTVRAAGLEKPLTLQVPEVSTARIESAVEFEIGKTVIIGGLPAPPVRGKKHELLVLMTVELVNTDGDASKSGDASKRSDASKRGDAKTDKLMFGTGVNSDAGVTGSITIDEEELAVDGHSRGGSDYTVVYNVADLFSADLDVIRPKYFVEEFPDTSPTERRWAILMDSIRKHVEPDSWADSGGNGRLQSFPRSLCIVVRHTRSTHQAIARHLHGIRKQLGLPAAIRLTQPPRRTSKQSTRLIAKTYNVADLVVPLPGISQVNDNPTGGEAKRSEMPDFESLIDLITSTIAVDSWSQAGGAGSIASYPTTLSVVVSQTSSVHDEIAELLGQVRRLQDIQVTLETRFIRITDRLLERLAADIELPQGPKNASGLKRRLQHGVAKLTAAEMTLLLKTVDASRRASVLAAPKITLFNGQQARIELSGKEPRHRQMIQFHAVCSDDRRSVRVAVAAGAGSDLKNFEPHTVLECDSLALVVTKNISAGMLESLQGDAQSSISYNFPYLRRFFEPESSHDGDRILLIVTPRIIVQEEEEVIPQPVRRSDQ